MRRREFLKKATALTVWAVAGFPSVPKGDAMAKKTLPEPSPAKLPRWRGFNLLEKFNVSRNERFKEEDFALISELGFNFVRLPMDYRCWIDPSDPTSFREEVLREIDEAIDLGEKHGIHVCLNFHRAPGYTVAKPPEKLSLWRDEEAQKLCALHWERFAQRYKGVPSSQLSFNLFNEPAGVDPETHRKVVEIVLDAIRKHDPDRLVICDGRDWGNTPPFELVGLGVAAATRGYQPFKLTHYRAGWVSGSDKWDTPTWPLRDGGTLWTKETLRERCIKPWKELEAKGVGVMVGEFGAYNKTPHEVVLSWMKDCLDLWREAGWGWALWNFRGSFGVLDSDRADVRYEEWRGHKLDREMLELLQAG